MYKAPDAPRSIGGVLDDAVRLYRETFSSLWLLSLIASILAVIPTAILYLGGGLYTPRAQSFAAMMQIMTSAAYWVPVTAVWLLGLVLYAAMFDILDAAAKGEKRAMGAALQLGFSRIGWLFVASLLFTIMVAIGFVLLIVPGIYLLGAFQLIFVAIVIENANGIDAFGVSWRLIKGYWWRSSIIMTVALVLSMVLRFVVGFVIGLAAAFLHPSPSASLLVTLLVSAVVNVFVLAWLPCALIVMYRDLKLRHEGSDLAVRVGALA
jgi:hypothetical protein